MNPSDPKPMKPDSKFLPISKLPAAGLVPLNLCGPLDRPLSGLPARGMLVGMFGLGMACAASAALTHRWPLNETSGATNSGGIFEAVSGSSTTALFGDTAGVIGNPGVTAADRAYLFKGNAANSGGNAVAIPLNNVLPATGSFSVFVTARFATNYQGGGRMLVSNSNSQAGRIDFAINGTAASPNNLTFFYGGTTSLSLVFADSVASPVLFDGGWHEVGVTRSGTTFQLYVDGVARGTPGTSSLAISTSTAYRIGRRNAFSGFFNNAISEVQVFDDARSTGVPILVYDADGDTIADSWEIRYFTATGEDPVADLTAILARCEATGDGDADGLDNLAEFTGGSDPVNPDTDADGLKDGEETGTGSWVSPTQTGTNRLKPDTDGDGLLDGQENNSGSYVSATDTGTNPNLADTDSDTFNDYLEIARSTSPVSNASTPGASSATPLVDLNAIALPNGSLSSWSNGGTLGRAFDADQSPVVGSIGGVKGVTFSGSEVMTGPVAPSNLTGGAPRTIQAWIFNPSTSTEETIVSWGRRDGPNGTSSAFFHGTNPSFGAVGNWGSPDMAWGNDPAAITSNVKLGAWTYVVYTYDGNEGRVYSNGSVAYTEVISALATIGIDNTAAARPLPIRVAGQNAANGTLSTAGQKGSLTIARLRIHDRVVPSADLGFNDTDTDGMKDWYEDFYGLNKIVDDAGDDTDLDGLTSLEEQTAGTNPSVPDSDGDGLPDGWEFDNFGSQVATPLQDSDNDGSTNLEEYQTPRGLLISRDVEGNVTGRTPFTGTSNPNDANSQPDSDNDNLPDGWEYTYLNGLSDGPATDSDLDTFLNDAEFIAGSDPGEALSTPNDTDADGLLDSWEITRFGNKTSQDGTGDPDGDGANNKSEQTGGSDPNDANSQPDLDDDGLPDGWEQTRFGDLDQDEITDFDLDGFSDLAEFTAGSNPTRSGNTPDNVDDTVTVALATALGLDEYSVKNDKWTFVRRIIEGETISVAFHQGLLYVAQPAAILKVNPADGTTVTLATRNTGDALSAGWLLSTARGIEIGPDGKIYFSTAFGTPSGEGVFRLNTDGSVFQRFLDRTNAQYDLFNAIDLAWKGSNTLYVTSRGAFDATNRPVYEFDAAGNLVRTLATTLRGPQGLLVDGDTLWVTGTNAASALVALDTTATAPVAPGVVRTGLATNPDVIELLGEVHVANFAGSVGKDVFKPALATVLSSIGASLNDMAVFSVPAGPSYESWALGFGLNPDTPEGGETGDFDGDGTLNGVEFALGLSPTSGISAFAITRNGAPATGITLTWPSAEGISFQVRSSANLSDWTTLEATILGAAGETTASWTAPAATGGKRFYRIEFTP